MTRETVLKEAKGELTGEELLTLYRKLILGRSAEQKIREVYPKDEIKTAVHLGIGQEAIPVGVCHTLPPGSKTFGTYRNHVLFLALTEDTDAFFAELYGKATAPSKGKSGGMHISAPERGLLVTSAIVGTPIPVAVGAAFANSYRGSGDYTAVFFGDGALEEGVFWESLNFACLHRLKIFFVCEDNELAIHTFKEEREGFRSIDEAVRGFECYTASGEAFRVQNVVSLTQKMLRQMEAEPRPAFLHLKYFRFLEHVGPSEDFQAGYRRKPSPEELERLDPLLNFEKDLLANGFSREDLGAVKAAVIEKIEQSVNAAREAPYPEAGELHTDVYQP